VNLKNIYIKSSGNKKYILESIKCGCFHCEEIFHSNMVVDYIDDKTAQCPKCGIDSVIPEIDNIKITSEMLNNLYIKYFNY
jgi:NAD-dependent SIR2 family protein deacetylase